MERCDSAAFFGVFGGYDKLMSASGKIIKLVVSMDSLFILNGFMHKW